MPPELKDQRVFDRFMAGLPVRLRSYSEGKQSEGFLRDISASGAKIVASQEPAVVNSEIEVFVELPDGHAPVPLKGQVLWTRNINSDIWNLGVKFSKIDLMGKARLMKFCWHEKSLNE